MVELRITVDDREARSGVHDAIARLWRPTAVGRLFVGDVEIGARVLIERKTIVDFVASLDDGRLFNQAAAMARVAARPLLVVEGEDALPLAGVPPRALRGALLSLMMAFRIPVLRTSHVRDTARHVAHIARQELQRLQRHEDGATAPSTARQSMDVLRSIPGVGDLRARRLVEHFGSIRNVVNASSEELEATEGVGPATAAQIRRLADAEVRPGDTTTRPHGRREEPEGDATS